MTCYRFFIEVRRGTRLSRGSEYPHHAAPLWSLHGYAVFLIRQLAEKDLLTTKRRILQLKILLLALY
jgi:hypothetical protein